MKHSNPNPPTNDRPEPPPNPPTAESANQQPDRDAFVLWLQNYAGDMENWRNKISIAEHDIALALWRNLNRPDISRLRADRKDIENFLVWVLYHHQGGKSPIGQKAREILGIGQFEDLTHRQIADAVRFMGYDDYPEKEIRDSSSSEST